MIWYIHAGDGLPYRVTVKDGSGQAQDLTGATVAAAAISAAGATVAGTASIQDAAGGVIDVDFAADALAVGTWTAQVRVTIGGTPETVSVDTVIVNKSAFG